MEQCVNEASIIIRNTKEPTLTLKVILTSPLIRDEWEKKDGGMLACVYIYTHIEIEIYIHAFVFVYVLII